MVSADFVLTVGITKKDQGEGHLLWFGVYGYN